MNFLTYLNGNQKKNPKWVDPMGKIWRNITTEDNINEAPLTWSVLPRKNWTMKIKNFHGVVQSNNTVFAGLWCCEIVTRGIIKLFICKLLCLKVFEVNSKPCRYNLFPGPGANQKWSKHRFHGYIDCYGLERHGAVPWVKL